MAYSPLKMLPTTRNAPTDYASLIGAKPGSVPNIGIPGMGGGTPIQPGPAGAPPAPGAASPALPVDASGNLPPQLLGQYASNLSGALKGELPPDVLNLLQQQAAEYGVGSGTAGSQFAGYAGLRNLGLTSLDRMKQAEEQLKGQFMSPAEKAKLEEDKAKRLSDAQLAKQKLSLETQAQAQELALAQQKFAAEQNQFQQQLQLKELQSLGNKYGGLPGAGYGSDIYGHAIEPGITYETTPYGGGGLQPMQYGVTRIT